MTGLPPPGRAEAPGPTDHSDPLTLRELRRATVWASVAVTVLLLWFLSQPLLLIVGGCVFAAMLDGGVRLLGKVLPIGRGFRLAIVSLLVLLFLLGFLVLAGSQIAAQFTTLKAVLMEQAQRILGWAHQRGLAPPDTLNQIGRQLMGSIGKITSALGTALGALSSMAAIVVIGLFVAAEPRLYERGFAWLLPMGKREQFYRTAGTMGHTMRRLLAGRLLGMGVEGLFTGVALSIVGVPMAAVLGIITGLLAFLPNIGAIVSGLLIVLVGFSGGVETGAWAVAVYCAVQLIDGYVIVPYVARRSVDLAPALVLGCQLLFGALFGILGLALADPIVAMVKVLLEKRSELGGAEARTR